MKNKPTLDEKIQLVPYDPAWKEIFKKEALRIRKKLQNQIVEIQHIGSTAIPNIYAKPIIDIMISVKNLKKTKQVRSDLVTLGYEYLGNANVAGRLAFRMRNSHNFNIALCRHQGKIWQNNIIFRDLLLSHPDMAKSYSEIKKKIFAAGADTLLVYSDKKHVFIDKIIKK